MQDARREPGFHLALCILTLASVASAQSFFNSRGLGEVTPAGDARIAALAEPSALSTLNPGIFVTLNQASFHVSALGAATLGTDGTGTRLLRNVRPAALNIATPFPFQTRLFGGINQKFNQDFDVWSESLADTAYRRHVVGYGGVYALHIGLAKSLFDKLCVGAEYDHILGGSRENWQFETEQGGVTSTDTVEVDYVGNTFRFGGSYQSRPFSLAAYYEPPLRLDAERYKHVHGVIQDTERAYAISLPQSFSLAAAANPSDRIGIDVGLTLYPWQNATITGNDTTSSLGYKNVWRGSVGGEYYLDSLHPVRAGYSHQTWYYNAAWSSWDWGGSFPIAEDGIHLGTSIPIPKFGSLDISGEVLLRETHYQYPTTSPPELEQIPKPSMREVAGRLMLTLSYSEAWTKRTRRWGY